MFDSAQFTFKPFPSVTPASGRLLRSLCLGYIAATKATPQPVLFGQWTAQLSAKPHDKFGFGRLWHLCHIDTGVRVGVVINDQDEVVVYVSSSLPRVLFGANHHHLHDQADVDAALNKLAEIVVPIFDLHKAAPKVRFKRLDLVRSLDAPLDDVKRTLRHARHRCSTDEPVTRRNSVEFDGSNTALFFYDKAKKDKLRGAGTTTRAEIRLRKPDVIAAHHGLAGPGLSLSYARAHEVYREILGQLPSLKKPEKAGLYSFLAILAAGYYTYNGVDMFDLYLSMVCSNSDSASRVRREVAQRVPHITEVNFLELAA